MTHLGGTHSLGPSALDSSAFDTSAFSFSAPDPPGLDSWARPVSWSLSDTDDPLADDALATDPRRAERAGYRLVVRAAVVQRVLHPAARR